MPDRSEYGPMAIAVMRILLGWIMLWAFFDKMFGLGFETPAGSGWIDGGSPSSFVEYMAKGVFAEFFKAVAGSPFVDIVLMLGCLGLGLALILGFASKLSSLLMVVFLIFMFCIEVPPADNPLVDYHIIYIVAMGVIYFCGGFDRWSINTWWKGLSIVKRIPILA